MKKSVLLLAGWLGVMCVAKCGELPLSTDAAPERARVVEVENTNATEAFEPNAAVVQEMVNRGMEALTGRSDIRLAWLKFVAPTDVVGLKVYCSPGPNSGTRPAVAEAVVEGLMQAGIPATNIIIWDKQLAGVKGEYADYARRTGIRLAGAADAGYDEKVFYDNELSGNLSAGDLEFDKNRATTGRRSYMTRILTGSITKIISIAPLLNHNLAGVCGNLYGLSMGSVDNTVRFLPSGDRLARAVPEIYAMHALSDHVVLCITDALIGQYLGENVPLLHFAMPLNEIWFSTDPVALDVLATQELDRERRDVKMQSLSDNPELFQNAALLQLGVPDLAKIRLEVVR